MANLICQERVGRKSRERESREKQHYSANPGSPDVEVGLGRTGQGLGCAILDNQVRRICGQCPMIGIRRKNTKDLETVFS